MPEIFPENKDAFKIWKLVSRQRIYVGMEGISVDLVHSVVWEWIDRLQIQNPLETMFKVLNIFEKTRELEEEKRELERDK